MRDFSALLRDSVNAHANGKTQEFFAGLSEDERTIFQAGLSIKVDEIVKAFEPAIKIFQDWAAGFIKAITTIVESPEFQKLLDNQRERERDTELAENYKWN